MIFLLLCALIGAFVAGCPVQPVLFHYRNKMVSMYNNCGFHVKMLCRGHLLAGHCETDVYESVYLLK